MIWISQQIEYNYEPVVATITVTITFENGGIVCDGEDKTFTITVNPTVEVNALSDQHMNSGQTSSLVNISSSTTNVTFNWTVRMILVSQA